MPGRYLAFVDPSSRLYYRYQTARHLLSREGFTLRYIERTNHGKEWDAIGVREDATGRSLRYVVHRLGHQWARGLVPPTRGAEAALLFLSDAPLDEIGIGKIGWIDRADKIAGALESQQAGREAPQRVPVDPPVTTVQGHRGLLFAAKADGSAAQYANLAQARNAAQRYGAEWAVYGNRPYYVGRHPREGEGEPLTHRPEQTVSDASKAWFAATRAALQEKRNEYVPVEGTTLQVQINNHMDALSVRDMQGAGVRGQVVPYAQIYDASRANLVDNAMDMLVRVAPTKWGAVKAAMEAWVATHPLGQNALSFTSQKGVDVAAPNQPPLSYENERLVVSATPQKFSFREKGGGYGSNISGYSEKKSVAARFYKWWSQNKSRFRPLDWRDLVRLIDEHGGTGGYRTYYPD